LFRLPLIDLSTSKLMRSGGFMTSVRD